MLKIQLLLIFLQYCWHFVNLKELTVKSYFTANLDHTSSGNDTNNVQMTFNISNLEFKKGFVIKTIAVDIECNLEINPKTIKNSFKLQVFNITDIASKTFRRVKIKFSRKRRRQLRLSRYIPTSCFELGTCIIGISYLVSNQSETGHVFTRSTGTLIIHMTEPSCDFDSNCTLFDEQSNNKILSNSSLCQEYCNILPSSQEKLSGKYGYTNPLPRSQPTTLKTKLVFRSGYKCRFHYSVWTYPNVKVRVSIHTRTADQILDVKDFKVFKKEWKSVTVFIGHISEPFYLELNVKSQYNAAFDNFRLFDCDDDEEPTPCSSDAQMMCSTGKCISKDKICDLNEDCLYLDDELVSLCGNSSVFSRCDFDKSDCGWKPYGPNALCRWKLQDIDKIAGSQHSHGYAWYLNKSTCKKNGAADLVLPLRRPDNITAKSCVMRLSYMIQGKASLFIVQCTKNCTPLFTINSGTEIWKTDLVYIPVIADRFKLFLVGQFNDDVDNNHHAIAIDNISFNEDCFRYDDLNETTSAIQSIRLKGSEQHDDNEMVPWIIGTVLGSFVGWLIVMFVVSACRRKIKRPDPSTYRKISTNSMVSNTLFGMRKPESMDDCYENETLKSFLGGSGIANVSPLYDWSQVKDIIRIFPRQKITVQRMIGKGAFGEVYYGLLADVARLPQALPVAIKMLPSLCSEQSKSEFFLEAILLSKLRHPNIVKFLGISVDEKSMYLLLELMEGGDLKSFVRECRLNDQVPSTVTIRDLVKLCIDVATGCEYLEQNRFIHRDIAARNCLLSEKGPQRVAKIADFGMTKNVFRTNYYRKNGMAMVPVKWMPPEAFHDGVFTSKTDVWGFGIVLWEVFTLGRVPYRGKSNNEVMTFVAKKGRLERPELCPNELYSLMCKCWETKPTDRPDFKYIMVDLAHIQKGLVISEENVIYEEIESTHSDTGEAGL